MSVCPECGLSVDLSLTRLGLAHASHPGVPEAPYFRANEPLALFAVLAGTVALMLSIGGFLGLRKAGNWAAAGVIVAALGFWMPMGVYVVWVHFLRRISFRSHEYQRRFVLWAFGLGIVGISLGALTCWLLLR